jgi:regulator of protease activity HflC (stomatin/prohibitin superfamily)
MPPNADDLLGQGRDRLAQAGGLIIAAVLALAGLYAWTSFYTVPSDSAAVVQRVEKIRSIADAKAAEVYSAAYGQSPAAVEFYEFTRTMQSYESILSTESALVLLTNGDLFKFLQGMFPGTD